MKLKTHFKDYIERDNYVGRFYSKLKRTYQPICSQQRIFNKFLKKLENPVLLTGFRKSGNTWVRFVIFNYFNIIHNNADRTLDYGEIAKIQYHTLERYSMGPFYSNFPHFYRSHYPYKRFFKYFKLIYLYRNPLDALISGYYVYTRNLQDKSGLKIKIDYYVLSYLNYWIQHYKSTIKRSDLIINYEELKENPFQNFYKVFRLMSNNVKEDALIKSIELSSFENIQKMGRETNRLYGHHDPIRFGGIEFTRSGKSGQYYNELKPSTIKLAKFQLKKNNIKFTL